MRLDEERPREGDAHAPTTGHVLGRLGHHRLPETETVEDGRRLGLEGRRVELFELLVLQLEADLVDVVGDRHLLDLAFEQGDLVAGGLDDVLDGSDVARLDLTLYEVYLCSGSVEVVKVQWRSAHVDVLGNLDIARRQGLQEGSLAAAVFAEQTVAVRIRIRYLAVVAGSDAPLSVVERNGGVLEEKATVEGEGVRLDVDIAALLVADEDAAAAAVHGELELGHVGEVLSAGVGADVGQRRGGGARGG